MKTRKLYKNTNDMKASGVCSGIAEYFNIDVTIVRLIWIFSVFATGGFSILAYFICDAVMPSKNSTIIVEPKENSEEEKFNDSKNYSGKDYDFTDFEDKKN